MGPARTCRRNTAVPSNGSVDEATGVLRALEMTLTGDDGGTLQFEVKADAAALLMKGAQGVVKAPRIKRDRDCFDDLSFHERLDRV